MEAMLAWGITHWPYLVFLLACIVFAIYATCKVMAFYHTRFTPLEKEITNIRGSVDRIEKYLIEKNPKTATQALIVAHSPKTLTEKGTSLLQECGGKFYIDNNLDLLIGEVLLKKPKSPLDIETYAIDALLKWVDSSEFIPVKNFIYNHPDYEGTPIELYVVINVLSLYLRDKYFERYPASQESGSA